MRIAVDAMGGDHAPDEIVSGCLLALREDPELNIILVGQKEKVERVLAEKAGAELEALRPRVAVHHAEHVITGNDKMRTVLKKKQDNSVVKSVALVQTGQADACVSAGSTGALVGAGVYILGRLKGVRRPGVGVPLPARNGFCFVIDLGANISCKATHLYQYAEMASIYCEHVLKVPNPRVGLINVGTEPKKGTHKIREANKLLKKASLNYVGFVEGHDIFMGACDVAVCDGFVGNVLLKGIEGFSAAIIKSILGELEHLSGGMAEDMRTEVLKKFKKKTDWTAYGGAPLLGVDGVCIVAHGKSGAVAIANAVKIGSACAAQKINSLILEKLA
jgi:glycerol-3-phosphate acyltransferase PlsX